MQRIRAQIRDAWQLFIAPGIGALLPWCLGFRWLRWLSRRRGVFGEPVTNALAGAPLSIDIADPRAFAADVRLVWLLDHCDLYLSLWRRAMHRTPWHLKTRGAWPNHGPFIAVGFHHGTGLWVFRSLRQAGHESVLVSARWDRKDFPGLPLRYWYGRLRAHEVSRMCGHATIFRPNARQKLDKAIGQGVSMVGVIDMPPRLAPRGHRPVRMLDQNVSWPAGVLDIAIAAGVPVVPYWIEFDLDKGVRTLAIGAPLDPGGSDTLQTLADLLDAQIRATPAAWLLWSEWRGWIADSGKPPRDSA